MKQKIIDFIIDNLFKIDSIRNAIFAEVDWQNSIGFILENEEEMKTVSTFWWDVDGWRGFEHNPDGSYYFHDIPEASLNDIIVEFTIKEENKNERKYI